MAARQHGVVSHGQLRGAGLSGRRITRAVEAGRLFPIHRAVFALGHYGVSSNGRMFAATLACGEGSVVSHRTASFLLGLDRHQPDEIDVIARRESGRAINGVRRRFAPLPEAEERMVRDGVPVTTPARTIVDVASLLSPRSLSGTVEQAAVAGVLDVLEVERILARGRRRGAPALRTIIDDWRRHRPETRVRSVLEAKLLKILSRSGLPAPEVNSRVSAGGRVYEVDFLWASRRLVVETDGERFHKGPPAQRRDARRNADLEQAGYSVLRFGWNEVNSRPERTIAEIARALSAPL